MMGIVLNFRVQMLMLLRVGCLRPSTPSYLDVLLTVLPAALPHMATELSDHPVILCVQDFMDGGHVQGLGEAQMQFHDIVRPAFAFQKNPPANERDLTPLEYLIPDLAQTHPGIIRLLWATVQHAVGPIRGFVRSLEEVTQEDPLVQTRLDQPTNTPSGFRSILEALTSNTDVAKILQNVILASLHLRYMMRVWFPLVSPTDKPADLAQQVNENPRVFTHWEEVIGTECQKGTGLLEPARYPGVMTPLTLSLIFSPIILYRPAKLTNLVTCDGLKKVSVPHFDHAFPVFITGAPAGSSLCTASAAVTFPCFWCAFGTCNPGRNLEHGKRWFRQGEPTTYLQGLCWGVAPQGRGGARDVIVER